MTPSRKEIIKKLLGWTEQQYCDKQFELGIKYLEFNAGKFAQDISYNARFWKHWRYEYDILDDIFISELKAINARMSIQNITRLYIGKHTLIGKFSTLAQRPHWNEFYNNIIADTIDEIHLQKLTAQSK